MSKRTLAIDETLANYLDSWKVKQKELLAMAAIKQDKETPIVHAIQVVTLDNGKYAQVSRVQEHNYNRWFRWFCVDNGFGKFTKVKSTFYKDGKQHIRGNGYVGICPHQLRHTHATALIAAGTDVKTVQARMGHSSPSFTLAAYVDTVNANDAAAANLFDSILNQKQGGV